LHFFTPILLGPSILGLKVLNGKNTINKRIGGEQNTQIQKLYKDDVDWIFCLIAGVNNSPPPLDADVHASPGGQHLE